MLSDSSSKTHIKAPKKYDLAGGAAASAISMGPAASQTVGNAPVSIVSEDMRGLSRSSRMAAISASRERAETQWTEGSVSELRETAATTSESAMVNSIIRKTYISKKECRK
jgi:hypothetical protein